MNVNIQNVLQEIRTLTDEQQAILDFAASSSKSLGIQARAGSGKTFILRLLAETFPGKRILYVTFSKLLAEEAKGKLPSSVEVKTAHALCYAPAKKFYSPAKKLEVNDYYRERDMFNFMQCPDFMETGDHERDAQVRENRRTFIDLVKYCKLNMVQPDNEEQIYEVVDYYGLSPEGWMYPMLRKAYEFSCSPSRMINFTEMVHTVMHLDLPVNQYDIILADEVQDSSLMLITLYQKCLAPGGRIIMVGDDRQAIYGFAGSRNNSMEIAVERFDAEWKSLSVNFRCGRKHIELAQSIVPDIQAHDGAIEGTVQEINELEPIDGELVLCRTNAPLVGPCLKLIKNGVKATIKGKDIAGPIINIMKKVNHLGVDEALNEVNRLLEVDLRVANSRKYTTSSIDAISERYEIARQFIADSNTVQEATSKINRIFSDTEKDGVIFSSAHKSKGLEAPRVSIINYDKIRISKLDMKAWQHVQEANLHYVAVTRPQEVLSIMMSNTQKQDEE